MYTLPARLLSDIDDLLSAVPAKIHDETRWVRDACAALREAAAALSVPEGAFTGVMVEVDGVKFGVPSSVAQKVCAALAPRDNLPEVREAVAHRLVLDGWKFIKDGDEIRIQGPNGVPGGTTLIPSEMDGSDTLDKWATLDSRLLYALADAILATTPPSGDGWVLVPIRLPAEAVSGIKDILESNYNMPSVKARPLWASLLEIIAGLSIEEQEAINEARANLHATNAAAPSAKGVA